MLDNKRHNELLLKLSQGLITDKERWELERASLDDAFLADALEGYYDNKENQDVEKIILNLDKKKSPKQRKLFFRWMSVAASLLALVAISIWSFNQLDTGNQNNSIVIAEANEEVVENKSLDVFESVKVGDIQTDAAETEGQSEKMSLDEDIALDQIKGNKQYDKDEPSRIKTESENKNLETNNSSGVLESDIQDSKAIPVRKKAPSIRSVQSKRAPVPMIDKLDDISSVEVKLVSGVVKDERGFPIKNALIKSEIRQQETRTDSDGQFAMELLEEEDILASAPGFTSQKLKAKTKLDIELKEASEILSEEPKMLAEMMPISKLKQRYKDSLEKYLKRNPINSCNSDFDKLKRIRLVIVINEGNGIDDIRFIDLVDQQCQMAIENAIDRARQQNIFDGSKEIKLEFDLTRF